MSTGDAFDDVSFGPVEPERVYHVSRFAVEDEDSTPTGDIRVSVDGHGYRHFLTEQDIPAAATLYWENEPTHLSEGESLTVRFTGATNNDSLQLYLEGFWHRRAKGADFGCPICAAVVVIPSQSEHEVK